jgi:hypothetical protein
MGSQIRAAIQQNGHEALRPGVLAVQKGASGNVQQGLPPESGLNILQG